MMAEKPAFIIDSNILITPKLNYYPMDLVPAFWASVAEKIEDGTIAISSSVEAPVSAPSDRPVAPDYRDGVTLENAVEAAQIEYNRYYFFSFTSTRK